MRSKIKIGIIIGVLSINLYGCGYSSNEMCKAIETNNVETVKEYLNLNPNLNKGKDNTIIGLVKNTLTQGAFNNETPLIAACKTRNIEIMELLLENGANASFTLPGCGYPLEVYLDDAYNKKDQNDEDYLKGLELLLSYGADPYKNNFRQEPYEKAVNNLGMQSYYSDLTQDKLKDIYEYNVKKARLFYKYSNSIVISKENNSTLLHLLACNQYIDFLDELLHENKEYVNIKRSSDGKTPLILAVKAHKDFEDIMDNTGVIHLLLEYGADINVKDVEGKTALDYARENNDILIIEMLNKN